MVGNPDIAGRDYQLRAEKAICEHFNKMFRRSLLVMPTGTGKTRTAVGVVELLITFYFLPTGQLSWNKP